MPRSPSLHLAEFAVDLTFDDLPAAVVKKHKDHILDGLGNGLAGGMTDLGRMILDLAGAYPTTGESSIWTTGQRINSIQAAFVNATLANIAELEDGHPITKIKPNCCITPAGFAVAEQQQSSGRALIVALAAGVEVCLRIGEACHVGYEGYARGWIATSSIGQFGAAVAAGRLLGLNAEQMAHALSLAGTQLCGIWSTGLTMAKRVAIGRASENGVLAALMASQGITGGTEVFDGEWGNIGSIISPAYQPELLTKGLGEEWKMEAVGLKCYPTKGSVQPGLDAIIEIARRDRNITAADVARIVVRTKTGIVNNKALAVFPPKDFWEAQNSMPYILARAFIDRQFGVGQLSDDKLSDEECLALARKVSVEISPEADRTPAETKTTFIDVVLNDGRTFSGRTDYRKGDSRNPITDQELHEKFRSAAEIVVSSTEASALAAAVTDLEHVGNVRELLAGKDARVPVRETA